MQALYFAYGSNLSSARMQRRVPSAQSLGLARLNGYRLTTDKAGRDGTGKANLRVAAESVVWGVVWQLEHHEWPLLDACERGYARIDVALAGAAPAAQTYLSRQLTDDPVLALAYRDIIVAGAREHALPLAWIEALERMPAR